MDGCAKIFTIDVTIRVLLSLFFYLKMIISLAAIPRVCGSLLLSIKAIVNQFYSTWLASDISQAKKQERRSSAVPIMGLASMEGIKVSLVHFLNHLMLKIVADHLQICLATISHYIKMASICSLTIELIRSALKRLRFGKSLTLSDTERETSQFTFWHSSY